MRLWGMRLVKNHPIIYAFWELILKKCAFRGHSLSMSSGEFHEAKFSFEFRMLLYIIMTNIVKKNLAQEIFLRCREKFASGKFSGSCHCYSLLFLGLEGGSVHPILALVACSPAGRTSCLAGSRLQLTWAGIDHRQQVF